MSRITIARRARSIQPALSARNGLSSATTRPSRPLEDTGRPTARTPADTTCEEVRSELFAVVGADHVKVPHRLRALSLVGRHDLSGALQEPVVEHGVPPTGGIPLVQVPQLHPQHSRLKCVEPAVVAP